MTLRETLKRGEDKLADADVPESKLSAWYLFAHYFRMERSAFFLREGEEASPAVVQDFEKALDRRCRRIPLEYIIGETEFMGLPFYVDERVLIPRQDTECLVEEVLKKVEGKDVLDLCCGSGCIGISLAKLGKCRCVTLSDVSADALAVAEKNAKRNDAHVILRQSDLFDALDQTYDVIVSNPPYIPTGDISGLMPEVREHEPHLALDGRESGLYFYQNIIEKSREFLRKDGMLFFEIGCDQAFAVRDMMRKSGYQEVEVKKDLAGLNRVVHGCYTSMEEIICMTS